jgi:FkbH-like protein
LDDTLWGGRIGDDGWDGIDLDPSGTGRHFLRLQFFLRGLLDQGVVLAIASKNHPEVAVEAFRRRPEMLLQFEDFVAAEIHWEPKSLSVQRILDRLNLSTAGVVFLDDNPVERAEVRRKFPDIFIPELPESPAERVPMLLNSGVFDRRVITEESRNRTAMYRDNEQRDQAMEGAVDIGEFLRNLHMEMEVFDVTGARDRVLELIHKTNQFNLTTRRYTWDELLHTINSGFGLCYRLKDRFGDNGIISVVLVSMQPNASAKIDLWLMSCRVLGRQVEEVILADVVARANRLGALELLGEYIPTSKNKLVCDLYPRLGFDLAEARSDGVIYRRSLDRALPDATLIRLIQKQQA